MYCFRFAIQDKLSIILCTLSCNVSHTSGNTTGQPYKPYQLQSLRTQLVDLQALWLPGVFLFAVYFTTLWSNIPEVCAVVNIDPARFPLAWSGLHWPQRISDLYTIHLFGTHITWKNVVFFFNEIWQDDNFLFLRDFYLLVIIFFLLFISGRRGYRGSHFVSWADLTIKGVDSPVTMCMTSLI